MKRELFFIHVHIPKCGGSTFQDLLKRNFSKPGAYYREAPIVMQKHKSIEIELMIQRASYVEVFSSHHVSLDLPFSLEKPKVIAISHVRNPVERFVSQFFYEKNRVNSPGVLHFDSNIKDMTLDEYIEYGLEKGKDPMHIKGQVWWLSGKTDNSGIQEIDKLIDQRKLYLFPLERFDESCVLLEKLFPGYFKNCAYIKLNVGQQKNELSENIKSRIDKYLNPLDHKLMEIANSQLDKLKNKIFSDDAHFEHSMNDFYDRCAKFEIHQKKMAKKQKILRKVNKIMRKVLRMD